MKSIVFTGGGTAGHIMPNIAIIKELIDKYNIYYIGSNGMEKEIVSRYPEIKFLEIPSVKFRRSLTPKNLLIPFKLAKAIKIAKKHLKHINPSLIFSKGGYVSLPTCIAGKQLHIPVITHESDMTLGLANKIIARFADKVCCSFESTTQGKEKYIHTGSPIRQEITKGNKDIVIQRHNINNNLPNILIVGGSLGATTINKVIRESLSLLKGYNIFHITGKGNLDNTIQSNNYYQIEFATDIENYMAVADLCISRAGSNAIFELLATRTPMILIPLPKTTASRGDQVDNAEYFKSKHFATVIPQDTLSPDTLISNIKQTLSKRNFYVSHMNKSSNSIGNHTIINIMKEYL